MLGLGTVILGGVLLGSAIKAGWNNMQCMSKPYDYLKDGTPVYRDRTGTTYINGEKTYQDWYADKNGHSHWITVGSQTKKVYDDTYDKKMAIEKEWDEKNKKQALECGNTSYLGYHPQFKQRVTTEMSTGKVIAGLHGKSDGTYWKYYLNPGATIPSDFDENAGIQITQEEYDKLNLLIGTHYSMDHFRYNYVWKKHGFVPIPK